MPRSKARRALPVVTAVVLADVVTKALAVRYLVPQRVPHDVVGEWLRLTLVYNPGAAFGLHVGEHSRWVFMVLTVLALGVLASLYRATRDGEGARTVALALVAAGAIGNLIDRVRSDMGVVDFLDVGVGAARWPTFNVADMAVSGGAMLLAWVLWREDQAADAAASADPVTAPIATPPRIS
ncbi:MAG: signal peptidase II [Gemmatimonadaceae bacterium]